MYNEYGHINLNVSIGRALFSQNFWISNISFLLIRHVTVPVEFQQRGVKGLRAILREAKVRFHETTLEKIIAWSANVAAPDEQASTHHRIALALDDDRQRKTAEIQALEQDLAHLLVK